MATRTELEQAGDGSMIRYHGGVCWKADGHWHALNSKESSISYGAIGVWHTIVFLTGEMKLDKVEILSLLPPTPAIPQVDLTEEQKTFSRKMAKRGIPYAVGGNNND